MSVRPARRLPGFRFEVQPPPPTDVLPRMDVAVFVGFAASGPLHTPVAVEDIAQFSAIFGEDIPLAWDRQHGELVYAYLAPAVRSFFQNGGQRCWIIRVAGKQARYNYFPMPSLLRVASDGSLWPAFAQARSEGSWSDSLTVGTSLFSRLVYVTTMQQQGEQFVLNVAANSSNEIIAGDLLRLSFAREGIVLLLAVQEAAQHRPDVGERMQNRSSLRVVCSKAFWFKLPATTDNTAVGALQAVLFTREAARDPVAIQQYEVNESYVITLNLDIAYEDAPMPGALLRIDGAPGQLWMAVQGTYLVEAMPHAVVQIKGEGLWLQQASQSSLPTSPPLVEKLTFTASLRRNNEDLGQMIDLAFLPEHPRYWNALPTDGQLYQDAAITSTMTHSIVTHALEDNPYASLWSAALDPRFSLAGNSDDDADAIYLPIGMPIGSACFLGHDHGTGGQLDLALVRDGLDTFSANLFLDWDMIETTTQELIAQADYLRYESEEARPLEGIYAALGVEEVSMIAVPDVLHRPWAEVDYDDVVPPDDQQEQPAGQRGKFRTCPAFVLDAPELRLREEPDMHGTFTLGWSLLKEPHAIYTLQEALNPDWSGAVTVYTGSSGQFVMYGRSDGDYYYRVCVEIDRGKQETLHSAWSKGLVVRTQPAKRWEVQLEAEYDANDMLALQRALVRMCAARGDLFAVLALPAHYREEDAMAHVETLKSPSGFALKRDDTGVPSQAFSDANTRIISPTGYIERSVFSYSALYHPWLATQAMQSGVYFLPPEGAMLGIMARRAIAREAWIAPANEQIKDVIALSPRLDASYWMRLQNAQINVLRQDPRGFLVLSADTLSASADGDLRPINVRRLLILLRRLALREGATYVFEPNGAAFQRLVQRGFESLLEGMFVRGAFAGPTPASSFRVITDSSFADQGRFIVELLVAPSLPLKFLTIRLVQSGTTGTITEVF